MAVCTQLCAVLTEGVLIYTHTHTYSVLTDSTVTSLFKCGTDGQTLSTASLECDWMSTQHWWQQKCSDKNPYQWHLIHHKPQLYWPGIEPQPSQWQSGRKCFGSGVAIKPVLKMTIMLGETCSRHDWTSQAVYKRLLNTVGCTAAFR